MTGDLLATKFNGSTCTVVNLDQKAHSAFKELLAGERGVDVRQPFTGALAVGNYVDSLVESS